MLDYLFTVFSAGPVAAISLVFVINTAWLMISVVIVSTLIWLTRRQPIDQRTVSTQQKDREWRLLWQALIIIPLTVALPVWIAYDFCLLTFWSLAHGSSFLLISEI